MQSNFENDGIIADYQYDYDKAGNIISVQGITAPVFSGGLTQYDHTVGNRLESATGEYQAQYTYDNNCCIISDGVRTFIYNQNNRLVKVKQEETVLAEYFYNGFNQRIKKVASGVITHYCYDLQGNLIAESSGDGTPLRDYIYLNGERIAMKIYGDQEGYYYFINDHLGTPQQIIDSQGTVVWKAAYQPFGEAQILIETVVNNFRFKGQYYDTETGLHNNWHRYYDPKTGRYIRADPAQTNHSSIKSIPFRPYSFQKNTQGLNSYTYAENSPLIKSDPLGLFTIEGDCRGKKNQIKAVATQVCETIDQTITCPKLAACMKNRCKKGKIKCKCCDDPDELGSNKWFINIFPLSTIELCANNNGLITRLNNVLLHELAHSCKWDHNGGCGVPGQGGKI